jgi:hypothetical protein
MPNPLRQLRKNLSGDALIRTLRARFDTLADGRVEPSISLTDALMSGFAVYALKMPSLLDYEARRQEPKSNLYTVYHIAQAPSDSQLRDILDPVDPECLRPCFSDICRQVQRGKVLESFVFYQGQYLLSFDGTEHYCSEAIYCPHCLVKKHRDGRTTYHHQLVTAVLAHPDRAEVIPLMPEPIRNSDGAKKNDCERNAAKRLIAAFRRDHPQLPVIATGDGLTSNAPLIRTCRAYQMRFIMTAKPGDHTFLFANLEAAFHAGQTQVLTLWEAATQTLHHFRWLNDTPLNEANADVLVNLLEYWAIRDRAVVYANSWVTDLELSTDSVWHIMRGGRTYWKIENETHNTLKNQGYHFEHNFGHGKQHLSVVFALLMLLAFFVDQVQQLCCPLFQAALQKAGSKRQLWEDLRSFFRTLVFTSLAAIWEAIARGLDKQKPVLLDDP